VHEAGWEDRIGVAGVMGRWAEVVGEDVAARCTPERFTDGVLVVRAATTAWATQLSYLAGDLQGRLAAVVGEGVVHRIEVLGPAGPSWRRGRLRVTGTRGPRDTYG
jgi:predicted nucleic acid-binding Zn ribbon protein